MKYGKPTGNLTELIAQREDVLARIEALKSAPRVVQIEASNSLEARLKWIDTEINGMRVNSMLGSRFDRWTVVGVAPREKHHVFLQCRCECGTERAVDIYSLKNGASRSCGCLSRETTSRLKTTHGETVSRIPSPEYAAFHSAKGRCDNPNNAAYKWYGDKGIRFLFNSVDELIADIGRKTTPQHSLDRYPNCNGNYEPGNVRWATDLEQNRNQKSNRMITALGKSQCVTEWAAEVKVDKSLLLNRLKRGWCANCVITIPVTGQRRRQKGKSLCTHKSTFPTSMKRERVYTEAK